MMMTIETCIDKKAVCTRCGSENIHIRCWATWDTSAQGFEFEEEDDCPFGNAFCFDCDERDNDGQTDWELIELDNMGTEQ